jgi:hypothetical protein
MARSDGIARRMPRFARIYGAALEQTHYADRTDRRKLWTEIQGFRERR